MSHFTKIKVGKNEYQYINMAHVVRAYTGKDRNVFIMVDGKRIEGEAEPLSDAVLDDVFAQEVIVPAQPGYSALILKIDQSDKVVFLTIAPVVSWRVNPAAPNDPRPIVLSDEDSDTAPALMPVETPNGSVVLNGCSTHESRDEWFASEIKKAKAEGFEVLTFDLVGAKTPAKKSYRAPAPKAAGSDANFASGANRPKPLGPDLPSNF